MGVVRIMVSPLQAYGELLAHFVSGEIKAQKLTHTCHTARRDSNLIPDLWLLFTSAPPGKLTLANHRW